MAKIAFIQDIAYEYFGVMYISSHLKVHGHECYLFIESLEHGLMKKLEKLDPDLIAFSTLTGNFKWSVDMAEKVKKRLKKKIIFGGVHVFMNPDKSIAHDPIDIICTGEGEIPMKQLCDSIDAGAMDTSIKGLWFKNETGIIKNPVGLFVEDLDSLTYPDRDLYWKYPIISTRATIPVLVSRGCPYDCAYCFNMTAKKILKDSGKFIRQRSAENIMDEIKQRIGEAKHKCRVQFVGDNFGNNRKLTVRILSELAKINGGKMTWAGAIRPEQLKEEYVKKLSKACKGLLAISIECGNEEYRRKILKRTTSTEQIVNATALARKYGISFCTLNMVGLPGETYEMALETLDLNIKIKPDFASCYIYYPYPNTELQRYAVENNFLTEDSINDLGFSWYDRYDKNNAELQRLINLQRIFSVIVRYPRLKPALLRLASLRAERLLDFIFGMDYLYYLWKHYDLTLRQIFQYVVIWTKNKVS